MKRFCNLFTTLILVMVCSNVEAFESRGPVQTKSAAPAPAPARPPATAPRAAANPPANRQIRSPQRSGQTTVGPQGTRGPFTPYSRPAVRPNTPYPRDISPERSVPIRERSVFTKEGKTTYWPNNTVHTVALRGMTITHSGAGVRLVEAVLPGRRVLVDRAGQGLVERPFYFGGAPFATRTYFMNHATYTTFYRTVQFQGHPFSVYTPAAYYSPSFYAWAARPWGPRVVYSWGWNAQPWFTTYGGAFRPYAYYPSAAPWLTDYLVSSSFDGAYQQQMDAAQLNQTPFNGGYSSPMPPQVKDSINSQMQAYVEDQYNNSLQPYSPPAPPTAVEIIASGQPHVFMAGEDFDVIDDGGNSCALTQGDTVQINPPHAMANPINADVQVAFSKNQDCKVGSVVTVAMNQLQEMENYMQATADRGLGKLKAHPGGVIPLSPRGSSPSPAPFIQNAPAPEPNVQATLQKQLEASNQAEKDTAGAAQGFAPSPY